MASLSEKINADLKSAMLQKNTPRISALRMLKSAVMNAEINKKGAELSDADVRGLIQKQMSQRRESIDQYKKGGRQDLVAQEEAELSVFEAYLPAQMDDAKLEAMLKEILSTNGITTKKEFGKAMKLAQDKLQGQAENQRVSALLGKMLP